MKKYILWGGVTCAAPILLIIGANYLTASETDVFYFLLFILSFPFMFMPSLLPHFGIIGIGDVFGFIYLSDALIYGVYYFILGMVIGWLRYRLKRVNGRGKNIA
jgi:hypothetical protein